MARRSSRLDTPPDAITGASVRSATLASRSRLGPLQRAVLGDVGDDEARTSFSVKAFQHRPQIAAVGLPAAAAQPVLAVGTKGRSARRARRPPCRRARRSLRAHHCGFSSAAVPRLTRAQPVASAADSDSSSRMPPDNSTATSSLPTTSASSSRFEPRPNAASRSTRWIHSAPSRCQVIAASSAEPYSVSLPACPCTSRTALPSTTSTAGRRISGFSAGTALNPSQSPSTQLASSVGAGVAALLRVELGGGQRTVLDGGEERHVVGRPGQQRSGSPSQACAA